MALDQIWKQQLTLVTYGNEYLSQNLGFSQWKNHSIFKQHILAFRDLNTQHLLAQHFQVWLEGLKKQGVTQLSLHNSSLLLDEKNPNPNVELLPYAHFIVSHVGSQKTAWICGKELAEWYTADHEFDVPQSQKIDHRIETLWRYELNATHAKRAATDLTPPNWQDIHVYTDNELFDQPLVQGLIQPVALGETYFGYTKHAQLHHDHVSSLDLSLLPDTYNASYAHETLIKLEQLNQAIDHKLKHPVNELGEALNADDILNLRHFQHKLEDLTAKFVTKVANHYKTARLTPVVAQSPLDEPTNTSQKRFFQNDAVSSNAKLPSNTTKPGKSGVFTLILITVIICVCAYYFGL